MKRTILLLSLLSLVLLSACEVFLNEHGGDGQSCFGDGSCNNGYTCTAGVCRPTSFVCDEQQSSCDGTWTTSCQSNKWVRITDCSVGDKICKDAACSYVPIDGDADIELPTDPCAGGDMRCAGSLKLVCEGTAWKAVTDCFDLGKSCKNGKCVSAIDGDAEKDTDADAVETEADDERDSELDTDKEDAPDGDPDADSDTPTEKESELDSDSEADADLDADSDAIETEREAETDTEAEAERESEKEAEIEVGTDCTSEPCCENGYWRIENAACVSGAEVPSCAFEECAASHSCLATRKPGFCLIEGVCTVDGAANPQNSCELCAAADNTWRTKSVNDPCDDANACTYDDYCDGTGRCVGTALTCSGSGTTCGEQSECQGTDSCKVYTPGADTACDDRNACTYNDACNGGGMCEGTAITCANDPGACGTKRTCNGSNHCTEVRPGPTTACESDGLSCTSDVCNGMGTCVHTPKAGYCVIAGICYADRANNPDNACQWCDATLNAWANKPTTEACNDALDCTYDDRCDGSGSCGGTYINCEDEPGPCGAKLSCQGTSVCKAVYPTGATSCDDAQACTQNDVCNGLGGCGGTAYACTTPSACETATGAVCNGDGSCSYPADIGATCNDGNLCTANDQCQADKTCGGAAFSCNGHGTCKGNGTCTCSLGFDGTFCDKCGQNTFGTYPSCFAPSSTYCKNSQCFFVTPTYQTKCYNDYAEITCPGTVGSEECLAINNCGQDAQYPDTPRGNYICYNATGIAADCATMPTASVDEVVVDQQTGIMWQRQVPTSYAGCMAGTKCTWGEAATYCNSLQYGGYSDWRLPDLFLLFSLVEENGTNQTINSGVFPGTPADKFCTANGFSASNGRTDYGWWIGFNGIPLGTVITWTWNGGPSTDSGYVRCMRNGPSSSGVGTFNQFVSTGETGSIVITDSITKLVWAKTYAGGLNWRQALAYCEALLHAGQTDWRLPNRNELLSLVNFSKNTPPSELPGMPAQTFWSSSTFQTVTSKAWSLDFGGYFSMSGLDKAEGHYARCVRGGP